MPYITSTNRKAILQAKSGHHHDRLISNWLDATYIAADSTGQKYVYPNLVVARDSSTNKYVPYNAVAGTYGTGCDTPVGVMDEFIDETLGEVSVTPIWHGKLIEAHCYLYGSAYGSIPGAVKTALDDIEWV